ncbi:MAG: hypothetical protein JWQ09_5256 [Segetibacter sp.]|nr:hypothetical protein [Segetibacter sp.]
MFELDLNEEELKELKQILSEYLAKKLVMEVDKIAKEKGYTPEIIESWKDEHFRTPYNNK